MASDHIRDLIISLRAHAYDLGTADAQREPLVPAVVAKRFSDRDHAALLDAIAELETERDALRAHLVEAARLSMYQSGEYTVPEYLFATMKSGAIPIPDNPFGIDTPTDI